MGRSTEAIIPCWANLDLICEEGNDMSDSLTTSFQNRPFLKGNQCPDSLLSTLLVVSYSLFASLIARNLESSLLAMRRTLAFCQVQV